MKQTQWHSSKGNSCRQMTLTKQKLLLEILYTLYVATKTSRIPRKAKRFFRWGIFCFEYPRRRSGKGNVYFAKYRFSFRKVQIFISQTTDSHFANYRFPFRKLQISISQTTDFHFVSSHFVSQTTVSLRVSGDAQNICAITIVGSSKGSFTLQKGKSRLAGECLPN